MTTLKDRLKCGKDARQQCSRGSQAAPGDIDRDPLPIIETSSEGRVKSLVELRYGRMLVSPFTFYRGNALLHAHDLAGTPNMGLAVPVCGDAHLMNFGGFATPERNLLFSVNDFDEAHPGPWEWDLKRLAETLLSYAQAYAEQNDHDFERFQKACRTGRLQARSEADFAADHLP
jgi:uncharacterized protein (DUF2252 family)